MSKSKAFTLIEILAVVAIVGILSAFVFVQTNNALNSGKDAKRKSDVVLLASGVASYLSESVSLPVSTSCSINNGCSTDINQIFEVQLGTLPTDPDSGSSYKYQSDGTDCTISAILSTGDTYQYSCSTDEVTSGTPTSGECGTAATTYAPDASSFSGTYCVNGTTTTPSFPSQGSEVSWSCPGTYLGESVTCTAYRGQDGSCGTASNTTTTAYSPETTDYPSSNFCTTGTTTTPSFPAEGSSSSWVCNAKYSGTNANCIAYRRKNGVCGSSNGQSFASTPTENLCSVGTASTITVSNIWSWTCSGTYEGSTASCFANLILVNNVHTAKNCTDAAGTIVDSDVAQKQCKFMGASCPSNWNQYKSYSTTTAGAATAPALTCSYNGTDPIWTMTCPAVTAYTGSHAWANIGQESVSASNGLQMNYWYQYYGYCGANYGGADTGGECVYYNTPYYTERARISGGTAYATITEIGCY